MADSMKCSKGFPCISAGLDGVCEARDIGLEHSLICMDRKACQECDFGFTVGLGHLCRCPVRVRIAKLARK